MAKGSQLAQLKSALAQAGLNKQPPSNKKRKHGAAAGETDKNKKAQMLQEISRKLNPFDLKVTKLKHDVGGRKIKGQTGKPQASKQVGIEQRKKTLLKEYERRNHAGGIIDRRFGENDPTMTPEERMLERFTKERQRAAKGMAFNLEDEDELTHYGQSLSKLDDFEGAGLGLDDDDEDSDGKIGRETVKHAHFGGFEDEEEDEEDGMPPRKKTKAEVMAEVITKSKQHKFERQIQRQQDADTRHQLDQELDDIRGLLFADTTTDVVSAELAKEKKGEDIDYDQHVRELALDRRAKPKDRTKTEEELALEAKEALEKAERKRQRRMMGEDDENSESERGRPGKKVRRAARADDFEDDFVDEGEDWNGLGAGLEGGAPRSEDSEDEEHTEDSTDEEEESDSDDESEDSEDTTESEAESSGSESNPITTEKHKAMVTEELPYTFPCPETLEDFLELVEEFDDTDVPTVIQRIRTLHHPSLGQDNKFKLQALADVLIDYILHITSRSTPSFQSLSLLLPHIRSLAKSYPIELADHFVSKLQLMQKNLARGLSKGATFADAKTWPGPSELVLLWTIGHVFPTSDMKHPVVSPARLLMGAYLGLSRVRSLRDIASGLFLTTLFLQYEEYSKRLVPEVAVCLFNTILHIAPHSFRSADTVPGSFPIPDFNSAQCRQLRLSKKTAKDLSPRTSNLASLLADDDSNSEQNKLDLLVTCLELAKSSADLYKSSEGFIEIFQPAVDILEGINISWMSDNVKTRFTNTKDTVSRLLKFARQSRKPLALQAHKPIPIATYIPKFESSSSSYLRRNDPDQERVQASKLRYQFKQERKGAIRELRKDSRFMASVKEKEQQEKDRVYADRMNKVFASMESERAEQKKMEREKAREKKRAGRK